MNSGQKALKSFASRFTTAAAKSYGKKYAKQSQHSSDDHSSRQQQATAQDRPLSHGSLHSHPSFGSAYSSAKSFSSLSQHGNSYRAMVKSSAASPKYPSSLTF